MLSCEALALLRVWLHRSWQVFDSPLKRLSFIYKTQCIPSQRIAGKCPTGGNLHALFRWAKLSQSILCWLSMTDERSNGASFDTLNCQCRVSVQYFISQPYATSSIMHKAQGVKCYCIGHCRTGFPMVGQCQGDRVRVGTWVIWPALEMGSADSVVDCWVWAEMTEWWRECREQLNKSADLQLAEVVQDDRLIRMG